MRRITMRQSSSFDLAVQIGLMLLGFFLVLLIISVFLLVKAVNGVVRVLIKHPDFKALWWALASLLVTSILALVTNGHPVALFLVVLSAIGVLLLAWIAQMY